MMLMVERFLIAFLFIGEIRKEYFISVSVVINEKFFLEYTTGSVYCVYGGALCN